jgi:hypothetical protein
LGSDVGVGHGHNVGYHIARKTKIQYVLLKNAAALRDQCTLMIESMHAGDDLIVGPEPWRILWEL